MGDYRPISLCTVAYKLISKIMCQRLQQHLDGFISESETAFVPRRQISDNILVAHELVSALYQRKIALNNTLLLRLILVKHKTGWNGLSLKLLCCS